MCQCRGGNECRNPVTSPFEQSPLVLYKLSGGSFQPGHAPPQQMPQLIITHGLFLAQAVDRPPPASARERGGGGGEIPRAKAQRFAMRQRAAELVAGGFTASAVRCYSDGILQLCDDVAEQVRRPILSSMEVAVDWGVGWGRLPQVPLECVIVPTLSPDWQGFKGLRLGRH